MGTKFVSAIPVGAESIYFGIDTVIPSSSINALLKSNNSQSKIGNIGEKLKKIGN